MGSPGLHVTSVQIENVKRVKAFAMQPTAKGLTIVGGKNKQGKTSVLDAIAWAIGGGRKAPSEPKHSGSVSDPVIEVELSNGVKVSRKGKNSALTVLDPSGQRSGQALLDSLVSEFALDLPKFMEATSKEKARTLLGLLGIGDDLERLALDEKRLYDERHQLGVMCTSKTKHAEELPEHPNMGLEPVSVSDLIQQQQTILATNGANQAKRNRAAELAQQYDQANQEVARLDGLLQAAMEARKAISTDCTIASQTAAELHDGCTDEIEQQIAAFETTNSQVAANQAKAAAQDEATQLASQVALKDDALEAVRAERLAILDNAELPLAGLSVQDAELVYNGTKWDGMSGADQLRVGVAIVRALKPECSFVLLDKLEQMDTDTLAEFGQWLEAEGLQCIATRVSTGEECSIIIEDGLPVGKTYGEIVANVKTDAGLEF